MYFGLKKKPKTHERQNLLRIQKRNYKHVIRYQLSYGTEVNFVLIKRCLFVQYTIRLYDSTIKICWKYLF